MTEQRIVIRTTIVVGEKCCMCSCTLHVTDIGNERPCHCALLTRQLCWLRQVSATLVPTFTFNVSCSYVFVLFSVQQTKQYFKLQNMLPNGPSHYFVRLHSFLSLLMSSHLYLPPFLRPLHSLHLAICSHASPACFSQCLTSLVCPSRHHLLAVLCTNDVLGEEVCAQATQRSHGSGFSFHMNHSWG